MKKLICSLAGLSIFTVMLLCYTGSKAQAQDITVSYQTFYDELSPYGQWVYDPEFGNVWVPNEGGDFRPYGSRGYWAMTEYGNTWISDDPWGWAVYHYGRWTYNPYYGWIWVPGYDWAPAWVSWRFGNGYAGWAPLSPGYYVGSNYGCPDNWWVFTGPRHLYAHDHYNYWSDRGRNHTYINQTTIINNVYTDNHTHVQYNYGPRASTIQQVTHQPVQVYRTTQAGRPGTTSVQQNTVNIYRPQVSRTSVNTARPANVIQAPVTIGRPQSAPTRSASVMPTFRQDVQRQTGSRNTGVVGPNTPRPGGAVQPQNSNPGGNPRQTEQPNAQPQQGRNQYFNHPEPARNAEPQRLNTQPEPQRLNPQPQQNRPEPQRFNPQRQEPQVRPEAQPQRFNQEQTRQEPQPRQEPRPQPQPQRQEPQPRQEPRPQPQPQRQEPQPRQEPRPQPQPQRQEPQPRQEPRPQPQPQQQQRPQQQPQPQQRPQPQPEQRPNGGRR